MSSADLLWYASYGSNMAGERLRCYLEGGCPPGAVRVNPGARDPSPPRDARYVRLAGAVYFAWESPTWGGGVAFYDPSGPGESVGRAYLVTRGQFADIAIQEMHREPGGQRTRADPDLEDADLAALLADGGARLGPGRYETLHQVGEIDGRPVVTFTASWRLDEIALNPPAATYVQLVAAGLRETTGWDAGQIIDYLLARPGVRPGWDAGMLAGVVSPDNGSAAGLVDGSPSAAAQPARSARSTR